MHPTLSFRLIPFIALILMVVNPSTFADDTSASSPQAAPAEPVLIDEVQLTFVTNGIATTADGRLFMTQVHMDGSDGPNVIEWVDGKAVPYPTTEWNAKGKPANAKSFFVRVNALRLGPEGDLWLVDTGSPGIGKDRLKHGAKLIEVNIKKNEIRRVYDLETMTHANSMVDDVRFNGRTAYITDAGDPGLIVLNLLTGLGTRVLDHAVSTTASHAVSAEHQPLVDPKGKPLFIHADQLEVSPDGMWLYFQPANGPLSRIETKWLAPEIDEQERQKHVELFAMTTSTGGTAIDNDGNIYVSDTDNQQVLKITPNATVTTLVKDPRLLWVDAMWVDNDGYLWMPAAQLNRLGVFQGGKSTVEFPVHIFKFQIGTKPAANDHN